MIRDDFCIFILTHGRPDRVITIKTLINAGYSGKIYIVIDDEDKTEQQYRDAYGDIVLQFSKKEISKIFDEGDNFDDRRTITYARNACWGLAAKVGVKYFAQFDDDYSSFAYRHGSGGYDWYRARATMDRLIMSMIKFYESINCLSLAMSQGGDHIGGREGQEVPSTRRKCMNSFICSTDRPFKFRGRFNEDVNTYTVLGMQGHLFLTIMQAQLVQKTTQSSPGGITELYKKFGTYTKALMTVMYAPSCVKVGMMGDPRGDGARIHHDINWHNCAPKILREEHKKK